MDIIRTQGELRGEWLPILKKAALQCSESAPSVTFREGDVGGTVILQSDGSYWALISGTFTQVYFLLCQEDAQN